MVRKTPTTPRITIRYPRNFPKAWHVLAQKGSEGTGPVLSGEGFDGISKLPDFGLGMAVPAQGNEMGNRLEGGCPVDLAVEPQGEDRSGLFLAGSQPKQKIVCLKDFLQALDVGGIQPLGVRMGAR